MVLDLSANKRGSLEQGVEALAVRLRQLGADTTFVFSDPPIESLQAALGECGAKIRILDFRNSIKAAVDFWQWLRDETPQLVHFHFIRAHSPLVVMAHLRGARVIVHDHFVLGNPMFLEREHSRPVKRLLRPLKQLRSAILGRCVDVRIAVSGVVAASIRESEYFGSERIEVIANGIDVSRFISADPTTLRRELEIPSRPIVACVSRMAVEKGVDLLIEAMSHVRQDAALLIAGDGPETERCKQLAAQRGLSERVYFLGLRSDVERVYACADVVVIPSRCDEAFGFSVVEAMSAGKPVIVTNFGALPEIVDNGECGVVVPKNDDVAMAAAISSLLQDSERARCLGEAARRKALAMYPLAKWVEALTKTYARVLSEPPAATLVPITP